MRVSPYNCLVEIKIYARLDAQLGGAIVPRSTLSRCISLPRNECSTTEEASYRMMHMLNNRHPRFGERYVVNLAETASHSWEICLCCGCVCIEVVVLRILLLVEMDDDRPASWRLFEDLGARW